MNACDDQVVDPALEQILLTSVVASRGLQRALQREGRVAVSQAIRNALEEGVAATKIAAALGVSRARVYQLRDTQ